MTKSSIEQLLPRPAKQATAMKTPPENLIVPCFSVGFLLVTKCPTDQLSTRNEKYNRSAFHIAMRMGREVVQRSLCSKRHEETENQ